MIRLLDKIIIITIIVQTISLADFFLKPKIIKRINNSIDTFTLKLDYIKTVNWLRNWVRTSRRSNIAEIILGIITTLIFIVSIGVAVFMVSSSYDSMLWKIGMLIGIPWIVMYSWGLTAKIIQPIIKENSKIFSQSKSFSDFIVVFIFVAFIELLLVGLFSAIVYWKIEWVQSKNSFLHYLFFVLSNVWFGILLSWILTFVDGIITLIIALLIMIFQWLINILRFIMWKISSYPKGPLAAITVLLAAIWTIMRLIISK